MKRLLLAAIFSCSLLNALEELRHEILCGDDWGWGGAEQGLPVLKAVTRFAKENRLNIHSNGWFWHYTE